VHLQGGQAVPVEDGVGDAGRAGAGLALGVFVGDEVQGLLVVIVVLDGRLHVLIGHEVIIAVPVAHAAARAVAAGPRPAQTTSGGMHGRCRAQLRVPTCRGSERIFSE